MELAVEGGGRAARHWAGASLAIGLVGAVFAAIRWLANGAPSASGLAVGLVIAALVALWAGGRRWSSRRSSLPQGARLTIDTSGQALLQCPGGEPAPVLVTRALQTDTLITLDLETAQGRRRLLSAREFSDDAGWSLAGAWLHWLARGGASRAHHDP